MECVQHLSCHFSGHFEYDVHRHLLAGNRELVSLCLVCLLMVFVDDVYVLLLVLLVLLFQL